MPIQCYSNAKKKLSKLFESIFLVFNQNKNLGSDRNKEKHDENNEKAKENIHDATRF